MQSKKSANKNYHFYKIVFGISLGFLAGSFGLTLYANAESTPNNQGGITTIASKVQYVRSINFSGAVMSGIIQNGKSYLSITSPISMGKSQEIKNNNTIYGNHEGNVAGENIVMFGGDKNTVYSDSIILGGSGNTIKGGIALGGEGNSGEKAIMFVGTKNKAGSGDFLLGGNDIKSAGGNTVFGDHVTVENGKSSNFIFSDGNFTGKGTDTFFLDVENGVGINTYGTTGVALTISGAIRIEKKEADTMPKRERCQKEGTGSIFYFSGCICACNGDFFESLQGVGEISDAEAERCTLACNQGKIELYQKFKITYNLNGGTGNIPEQEYKKGETNLRVTTSIPTKANFTFLRREETIGANTVSYQSGANIDSNTGHILKAVWGGNKYTVTFDADGGTPNNEKKTVTYGDTYPYADFPKVTKTNNCFTGWYYNTTRITNQSKVEANSSHTLKAHWIFIQGATKYDTNTCKAVQCDTTNNNNPDTCPTGGHCTPVTGYTLSNGSCNPVTKQRVDSCEDKSTTYPLIASQKVTGGRYEEITSYKKDGNACIEEKRYKFIGCEAGYAGSNNTCTPCGIGTYAPQGSSQCISCGNGLTSPERSTSNAACVSSIVTCSATTYYDGNTQICKSCEAGSYCPGVQVPRYSPTTTGMIICPSGSYAPAGAKSCTQCPAGTYSTTIGATNNKTCQACGGGKWSTTGANVCQNIQAGCYGTSGKTQCPNECKAGTYSVGGASACSPVIAGCYGDQKKATTSCPKECTAGYYSTGGATACSKVQAGCKGSAKATTSCPEACEIGMYSLAGSSSCSPCTPNPLTNGEYTSNGTTAQGCTFKCNAGYQAGTNRNCVGKSIEVTFNANGGKRSDNNTTKKKNSTFGSSYSTPENPSNEGKQFAGWYFSSSNTSTDAISTVNKDTAHTVYAHWTTCTPQNGANSYNADCSIKECKADFYKNGNACIACIDGYSSPAGSTTNSQCTIEVPAGYYLKTKNTTSIEACAKGSYKAKHTVKQGETSSCDPCTTIGNGFSGWTSNGTSANSCEFECKNGYSINGRTCSANAYTITYTLNGGTVSPANPTSYTVEKDTFTLKNPIKNGSIFKGWTGSNGSTPSTSVTISKGSTGNKSYTANWQACTACSAGAGATCTLSVVNNQCVYTTACTNSNYTISNSGTYHPSCSANTCTITYDANGGTVTPTSQSVDCGSTVNSMPTPTKTGYTFGCWEYINNQGANNGCTIKKGSTIPFDITLKAPWTANTYTINYDLSGGSFGANHPTTGTYDESFTISNPTRNGYTFSGWKITGMDSTTHTYGSQTTTATSIASTKETTFKNLTTQNNGSINFVALWEKNSEKKYYYKFINYDTIISTLSGKTYSDTFISSYFTNTYVNDKSTDKTYNYKIVKLEVTDGIITNVSTKAATDCSFYTTKSIGTGAGLPQQATLLTHFEGYTVVHIKIPKLAGGGTSFTQGTTFQCTTSQGETVTVKSDIISVNNNYSGSEPVYTISFDANGGSGAPSNGSATHGKQYTLSTTKPTKNGYTFLGWSTNKNATSASYQAGGKYTFYGDTTLYAIWKLQQYTITYNAMGGSGAPSNGSATYGEQYTLSTTEPTKNGYTFLGWSSRKNAKTATYQAGGKFTCYGDKTLYAIWKTGRLIRDTDSVPCDHGNIGYFDPSTPTYEGETDCISGECCDEDHQSEEGRCSFATFCRTAVYSS